MAYIHSGRLSISKEGRNHVIFYNFNGTGQNVKQSKSEGG